MNTSELPDDVIARIEADFAEPRRAEVTEALLGLPETTREQARVARCVLFVADGDLAHTDYRDAIVAAEYDREDRRLRDLSRPFGEAELSG